MLTPRDQLFASHDEFRKLAMEHTRYEQRLSSLTQKRYLTPEEAQTPFEGSNGEHRAATPRASPGQPGSIESTKTARLMRSSIYMFRSAALLSAVFICI